MDDNGEILERDTNPADQPRFLLAIMATEEFLKKSDDAIIATYFENKSKLPSIAQNFDFVTGSTGAHIDGETDSLITTAAQQLDESIGQYGEPSDVARIYENLYKEPIKKILGDK